MEKLIEPPVAADLDVRKFPYMPLDVKRLLHSDFMWAVSDAEFKAAITLWAAAWHQVPAGSLPNNDRTLCAMVGLGRNDAGLAEWKAIKNGALYGFKLANDGRFYHTVIVETAIEAEKKMRSGAKRRDQVRDAVAAHRERKKSSDGKACNQCKRLQCECNHDVITRKEGKGKERNRKGSVTGDGPERQTTTPASPGAPGDGGEVDLGMVDLTGCRTLAEATRQTVADLDRRIGQEAAGETLFPDLEPQAPPVKAAKAKPAYPAAFEVFWKPYPRKVGKDAALKAWKAAVKRDTPEAITEGAVKFAALCKRKATPEDKIPHPSTWLNAGRWRDEGLPPVGADGQAAPVRIQDLPGNKFGVGG